MKQYSNDIDIDIAFDKNAYFENVSYDISRGAYLRTGEGSGRMVYNMEKDQVVKVAKNQKGIAQNQVEHEISSLDDSGLFAHVIIVSDQFHYLVMDRANPVPDMSFVWNYFQVKNNQELYRIRKLKELSFKYNLLLQDFGRAANWGQIDGKPVIIDYGFTKQVRRRFYRIP